MDHTDPYQLPISYRPSTSTSNDMHVPSHVDERSIFPDFGTTSSATSNPFTLPIAPPLPPPLLRRSTLPTGAAVGVPAPPVRAATTGGGGSKKRRPGRGRMMMVKVLYSLASPRFSNTNNPNNNNNNASSSTLQADSTATKSTSTPQGADPTGNGNGQHSYTCLARLSAPVWVQLLGPVSSTSDREKTEYGRLTLKTCLSAICISRPELVTDSTKDYAVAAVDPYESSLQPAAPHPSTSSSSLSTTSISNASSASGGQGLMEGKGMLSWNLAEKREGTTWVCGRVLRSPVESTRRVRRKLNNTGEKETARTKGEESMEDTEEENEDDESMMDTLEVWLQLAERPSFTQTQFLTSLRSFANPPQPQPSSDRPVSPPLRQHAPSSRLQPLVPSVPSSRGGTALPRRVSLGDPVKKKRPRPSDPLSLRAAPKSSTSSKSTAPSSTSLPASASTSTNAIAGLLLDPTTLAGLPAPQVLALLSQLDLNTPQGRALLPAIRTLAEFYGIEIPQSAAVAPAAASTRLSDIRVDDLPVHSPASSSKGKGIAKVETKEHFVAVKPKEGAAGGTGAKGTKGGILYAPGCANCKRKKSTIWRESNLAAEDGGKKNLVCNACGVFYNKNNHHRVTNDRNTSPAASTTSTSTSISVTRPLKGRLTATCESELLSRQAKSAAGGKKRKSTNNTAESSIPSLVSNQTAGPSQSHPQNFGSIFRGGAATSPFRSSHPTGFTMTSPPRRSPRQHGFGLGASATSPARGSAFSFGLGTGGAFPNDDGGKAGRAGEEYDFSAMYSGHPSPSPERRRTTDSATAIPSYLLTASPGTALKRILSDTNIDLGGFDEGSFGSHHQQHQMQRDHDAEMSGLGGGVNSDTDLSFFLRSSSEEKQRENDRPLTATSTLITSTSHPMVALLTTDDAGPSTDFDSILSSLRRDFSARLSSNALTAPSSPPVSSPCVQPRTSSATPGTKGKAPESSGRRAPSILDSFIDGLVPALVLNPGVEKSDASDDDWTTPGGEDGDLTMTGLDDSHERHNASDFLLPSDFVQEDDHRSSARLSAMTGSSNGASTLTSLTAPTSFASSSTTRLVVPTESGNHAHSDFDFGSLPPSSPPTLPEAFTNTPSDFEGITPDAGASGEEMMNANGGGDDLSTQDTVAALLQSLGLPAIDAGAWTTDATGGSGGADGGTVALDRSTVTQLLQLIAAKTGAHQPLHQEDAHTLAVQTRAREEQERVVMRERNKAEEEKIRLKRKSSMDDLFDSLFSEGVGINEEL